MKEDITKGMDDGQGGYYVYGIMQEEDIVKESNDEQGGRYRREG